MTNKLASPTSVLLLAFGTIVLGTTASTAKTVAPKPVAEKPALVAKESCHSTGWTAAANDPKTIIDAEADGRWIVSAGMVSPGASLIIHYKLANRTGGEIALGSGSTEIVEGKTVSVELVGGSRPTASGTYRPECKGAK